MRRVVLPLLLYFAISIVWTWPLSGRMSDSLPVGQDSTENVWKFWWLSKSVFQLHQTPYWCDYQLHPEGISLLFSNPIPLYGIVSAPVLWRPPSLPVLIALANSWLFLTFPLSAWCCYLLCRRITGSASASLVGGFLFGFMPLRMAVLTSINVASTYWLPLFLLAGLPARGERDGPAPRRGLLAGLCLVGAFLTSLTALFFLVLLVPFSIAFRWARPAAVRPVGREVRFWLWAAVPVLCLALIMLASAPRSTFTQQPFRAPEARVSQKLSASPAEFFQRSDRGQIQRYSGDRRDHPLNPFYVGWSCLALCLLAAPRASSRLHGGFFLLLLISLVLALGPEWSIRFGGAERAVKLPYAYFRDLGPPLSLFRTPYRFMHMAYLAISVLSALGIRYAADRVRSMSGASRSCGRALILLAGIAVLPDFYQGTIRMKSVGVDPMFERIRRDGEQVGSVLILPAVQYSDIVPQRLGQVVMDRPIPISTVTRVDYDRFPRFGKDRVLGMLLRDPVPPELGSHRIEELGKWNVGWIAVPHGSRMTNDVLSRFLGGRGVTPIARGTTHEVFRVPHGSAAAPPSSDP
ncbi:MAG: hypothetical protein ABIK65_15370 [Candidatus Eisenbacteria bacterium]